MHVRPDIRVRKLALLGWAAALIALPEVASAQALVDMQVVEPRTFGHVVGDTLRREILLTLDPDYRLDPDSVPEAERIDRWIERAEPQLTTPSLWQRGRYHLVLTYRILDAPQNVETISLPQENLRIVSRSGDDEHVRTTLIPTLRINVSPITAATSPDDITPSSLQPDRPPAPIPLEPRQRRLAWTGAGLAALLIIAVWQRAARSWIERRRLPFARAVRALKRSREPATGLRIVHDAINRTAGRAVFTHNLDDFVATHAEYAALRDDLRRLFAASDQAFFRQTVPPGNAVPELVELCRRARRIERRTFRARGAHQSTAEQAG